MNFNVVIYLIVYFSKFSMKQMYEEKKLKDRIKM